MKRVVLIVFSLVNLQWVFTSFTMAQTAGAGLLPRLTLTKRINNNWKLAGTLESRFPVVGDLSQFEADPSYRLSDLSFAASRKAGSNFSLNFSYTLRLLNRTSFHRQAFQFNLVSPFLGIRLAQRLGTDVTFPASNTQDLTFRIRYRMLAEIPLSGESINRGEFYFKPGNEWLASFHSGTAEFETRYLVMMGYEINKKNRLEFGIDHRLTFHPIPERSHYSWLAVAWFISL